MNESNGDVTLLLSKLRAGDSSARDALLDLVYEHLRAIAGNLFRQQPDDHTLQPTALVHEAYVRLLGNDPAVWEDRSHFYNTAALAMRQILTDYARRRRAQRHGGSHVRVELRADSAASEAPAIDLIDFDDLLAKLAESDERLSRLAELRFLAGFSVEETARMLDVSPRTVELDTRFVRAWFARHLGAE